MTYQTDVEPFEESGARGDSLAPGTPLCEGQYVIDEYLNSGGFGITYMARDSLDRQVVIKECFPNAICCRAGDEVRLRSRSFNLDFTRAVDLFEKEARALARLQHPNIVGVHQIFQANGTAYMALDFVEGTDLFETLLHAPERLHPKAVQGLAEHLLQALSYVHKNGILHRDISPDNILLDAAGQPVLIDFGAARQSATQASRILSRVHTVKDGYSPHEFYIAGSAQSPSSDLYALAATFVHLIEGHPPPNSSLRLAAVAEQAPDPFVGLSGRFPDYDPTFLKSIDTCMSLFAKDRLQNADAWLAMITGRVPQAEATVADTGEIERIVAELVEKTHVTPARPKSEALAIAPPPAPEDPREAARREAEREYWSILNENPEDWYGSGGVATPAKQIKKTSDPIKAVRRKTALTQPPNEPRDGSPETEPERFSFRTMLFGRGSRAAM